MRLTLPRRSFLSGLASILAAPIIVQAANIMAVKALPRPTLVALLERYDPRFRDPLAGGYLVPEEMAAAVFGPLDGILRTVVRIPKPMSVAETYLARAFPRAA